MDKTRKPLTITIDPKMFISGPYEKCPKCRKESSFGILTIGRSSYRKRCGECMYSASYSLPPLNKKVIYLDQFIISDMMKAINERVGKTKKVDNFFLQAFSELDILARAQVIICPDSEFHRQESMISDYFKALKRMYEHLSNGTTFYDPATIKRFQIQEGFKSWLKNYHNVSSSYETDAVLHGDKNGWQDKFLITVDFKIPTKEIDDYRNSRLLVYNEIKKLFEEWKKDKKSFKSYYDEESSFLGPSYMKRYFNSIAKFAYSKVTGQVSTDDYVSLVMSDTSVLITSLMFDVPDKLTDEEKYKKIALYLHSPDFKKLPFNVISSALWAAIRYQTATGGRKTPPNIGMVNDIEMVSTLYPYCDVMVVDRDMFSLLNFGEVAKVIGLYKTKLFSLSNKNDFFAYLKELKSKISIKHSETLEKVYGKEWERPFYEMYDFELNEK